LREERTTGDERLHEEQITQERLEHVTICVEQRIAVAAGPAHMHFCNLF
jgi:hypothetical protein